MVRTSSHATRGAARITSTDFDSLRERIIGEPRIDTGPIILPTAWANKMNSLNPTAGYPPEMSAEDKEEDLLLIKHANDIDDNLLDALYERAATKPFPAVQYRYLNRHRKDMKTDSINWDYEDEIRPKRGELPVAGIARGDALVDSAAE
jgi:hypothetical protein